MGSVPREPNVRSPRPSPIIGHWSFISHTSMIVFFGSLLTAICLLWLVAIVDTIAGRIVQPTIWGIIRWFGFALVVGSLAAFTIARFLRTRHRFPLSAQEDNVCGPDRIGAWTFGANILAIVGAVVALRASRSGAAPGPDR